MKRAEFIDNVHELGLEPHEYVVVGSGVLCALGLREASDIDVIVTPERFKEFELQGWDRKEFPDDPSYYLSSGLYEVGIDWDSEDGESNLEDLKSTELIIEGIPFLSLERLKKWKLWKNTPKHLADVRTIDEYLAGNTNR